MSPFFSCSVGSQHATDRQTDG